VAIVTMTTQRYNLASCNSLLLQRSQNVGNGVTFFVHFSSTPTSILNLTISLERFQRYIVHTEILSTFHARVEYISWRTIHDSAHSNECAHTDRQTNKSENSISARLGRI